MYIRDKTNRRADNIIKSIPKNYGGSMYNFNEAQKNDEKIEEIIESTPEISEIKIENMKNNEEKSEAKECFFDEALSEKCEEKQNLGDKKSISKALGSFFSKGISSEDLLILGIIALIVFNEGDNETIILLALLYLSGLLPW